jgi:hypothetical protein
MPHKTREEKIKAATRTRSSTTYDISSRKTTIHDPVMHTGKGAQSTPHTILPSPSFNLKQLAELETLRSYLREDVVRTLTLTAFIISCIVLLSLLRSQTQRSLDSNGNG